MKHPACVSLLVPLALPSVALAHRSYKEGCQECHGGFKDKPYRSPSGETWPTSLHDLHRKDQYMGGASQRICGLCHIEDGDATVMGNARHGPGCLNCHGRLYGGTPRGPGLREHHRVTGGAECRECHDSPETSLPEDIKPPAYGGSRTRVDDPCNTLPGTREDWSGNGIGLDNDGDGLYDGDDPDCGAGNEPPDADFTFTVDVCRSRIALADGSSDPDPGDAIVEWAWDFGDDGSVDATQRNPTWDTGAPGTFTVRLSVRDRGGELGTRVKVVTVEANQPPAAAFDASVDGQDVHFTDGSSDPDGELVARLWMFGDGETSTASNPAHTYPGPGTYTVTLTVTDDCGESRMAAAEVNVSVGFLRSDCNGDRQVDIGDPIRVLGYLFGGASTGCLDACDSNDTGAVDLADAIYLLNHLFAGGPAPPSPFPDCGSDPTEDRLACADPTCP